MVLLLEGMTLSPIVVELFGLCFCTTYTEDRSRTVQELCEGRAQLYMELLVVINQIWTRQDGGSLEETWEIG